MLLCAMKQDLHFSPKKAAFQEKAKRLALSGKRAKRETFSWQNTNIPNGANREQTISYASPRSFNVLNRGGMLKNGGLSG